MGFFNFLFLTIFSLLLNDAVPDLGAPGYTCDSSLMARSAVKPTSAHEVRPADIDLVMAFGDSLTAGDCLNDCSHEWRGFSWPIGGDQGLDNHVSIPNILSKYNPNVFGASHGTGPWNDYNVSCLNMAIGGRRSNDLPNQANALIATLKAHPEIDLNNTWKLLSIFIGYNDIGNCPDCWCYNQTAFSAQQYQTNIRNALNIVRTNIPKVIVNIVQMNHLEQFILAAQKACNRRIYGGCINFTDDQMSQIMVAYQQAEKQLEQSGEFDTTDDFTLVVQPFYTNATPPYYSNGTFNRDFFGPDCLHYSAYGHALLATFHWQNLLQPVGSKIINPMMINPAIPLACPDPSCPYIRTTKNSINCKQFNGTCISDGDSCTTGQSCCSGLCFNQKCS